MAICPSGAAGTIWKLGLAGEAQPSTTHTCQRHKGLKVVQQDLWCPLKQFRGDTVEFHHFSSFLKRYPWVIALIKLRAVKQLGK